MPSVVGGSSTNADISSTQQRPLEHIWVARIGPPRRACRVVALCPAHQPVVGDSKLRFGSARFKLASEVLIAKPRLRSMRLFVISFRRTSGYTIRGNNEPGH